MSFSFPIEVWSKKFPFNNQIWGFNWRHFLSKNSKKLPVTWHLPKPKEKMLQMGGLHSHQFKGNQLCGKSAINIMLKSWTKNFYFAPKKDGAEVCHGKVPRSCVGWFHLPLQSSFPFRIDIRRWCTRWESWCHVNYPNKQISPSNTTNDNG